MNKRGILALGMAATMLFSAVGCSSSGGDNASGRSFKIV